MNGTGKARAQTLRWRKSTLSQIDECVEVAVDGSVLCLRDSKDPDGPVLRVPSPIRAAFAASVRALAEG